MSDERARWRVAGAAVLALALFALVFAINPANLPESWLERWLETKLPLGSSIVSVRTEIEKEQWRTINEWVGAEGSLVLVQLGRGWLPPRDVKVYFSFDRFGRLVTIDVQKTRSSETISPPASLLRRGDSYAEVVRHRSGRLVWTRC